MTTLMSYASSVRRNQLLLGTGLLAAILGGIVYTTRLPSALSAHADTTLQNHIALRKQIEAQRGDLQAQLAQLSIPNLTKSVARAKLMADLDRADARLNEAKRVCGDLMVATDAFFPSEAAVTQRLAPCDRATHNALNISRRPMMVVKRWRDLFNRRDAIVKDIHRRVADAESHLNTALHPSSPTTLALAARSAAYPHRADDLSARVQDLSDVMEHIQAQRRRLAQEAERLGSRAPDAAIDRFTDVYHALVGPPPRNGLLSVLKLATEDLDARLEQLDTHEATHILRLTQTPSFHVRLVTYCSEYDDLDESYDTYICKDREITTTEAQFFNTYTLGKVVRKGDLCSSEEDTVVREREVRYTYTARIADASGDALGQPTEVRLDEATFFDHYEGALALRRLLPESGAVVKDRSRGPKTEGVPLHIDMDTRFIVDHKPRGTYADEAGEAPAPMHTPLHLVDRPEFGAWTPDAGGSVWTWHESVRAQWSVFNAEHAPYYARLTRAQWDAYNAWRVAQTYDRALVDRSGKPVERDASKRRRGKRRVDIVNTYIDLYDDPPTPPAPSHNANAARSVGSVRGAGVRARSRGMGGGGK